MKRKLKVLWNGLRGLRMFDLLRMYLFRRRGQGASIYYSPWFHKKLVLRPNTADYHTLVSTMMGYHLPKNTLHPLGDTLTIVDLGSNIGLTLLDFKRLYPSAKIYGVEMDLDNFEMAQKNCSDEKGIDIVHAAISCADGWAQYNKTKNTDAYSICSPVESGQGLIKVPALTIRSLMKQLNVTRIDYLKMDIEGVEYDLFTSPEEEMAWLNDVQQLNIEYHRDSPETIISVLRQRGFVVEFSKTHWSSIYAYRTDGSNMICEKNI